ncbi:MAG: hypothetical protein M1450_01335 [Patescibacteria group bacterium]|nr:hypothetical protein [Patescibacteria group bacterium]
MGRERLKLSVFEGIFHRRGRKVTLSSEIEGCFEYFDGHSPEPAGGQRVILIHGNGITLKKVEKGKVIL